MVMSGLECTRTLHHHFRKFGCLWVFRLPVLAALVRYQPGRVTGRNTNRNAEKQNANWNGQQLEPRQQGFECENADTHNKSDGDSSFLM